MLCRLLLETRADAHLDRPDAADPTRLVPEGGQNKQTQTTVCKITADPGPASIITHSFSFSLSVIFFLLDLLTFKLSNAKAYRVAMVTARLWKSTFKLGDVRTHTQSHT